MKLYQSIIISLGLMLSTSFHTTADVQQYTPESAVLLNQLEGKIKGTLLAVAENENRVGNSMTGFHFSLNLPAQQISNLGLILDVDNSSNGYEVLSVTPGSTAASLAIKGGDRVLAINDIKINASSNGDVVRRLHDLRPGEELKIALLSDGIDKEVTTRVAGQYIPEIKMEIGSDSTESAAASTSDPDACGEISIFFPPNYTEDLHPVSFFKINGDHKKSNRVNFRLPVGKSTIYLHEYINDPFLKRRTKSIQRAKPIEIDIKANTTYYLAAKFLPKKNTKIFREEYWKPVVWKTAEVACKL